ncbi:MAG: SEFIR domain-containing protein [Pseudomonadota bacterium]
MERQVFISYAAGDTDWTAERVAELAACLDRLQLQVLLDVRHQQSFGQKVPPAGWREWMSQSMATATHIVCLCSERYAQAWRRNESLSGGCGVAFESARIERYLYDHKQNNHGRVLALVCAAGKSNCVPESLSDACPTYVWGDSAEDALLQSHLCRVVVPDENDTLRGMTAGTRDSSSFSSRPVVASEADGRSAAMLESAQQAHEKISPLDKPVIEDAAARLPDARSADPKPETSGTSSLSRPFLLLTVNQRETDALRAVFGAGHISDLIVYDDYPYERFASVIDTRGRPECEVIAFSCQMGSERSGAALQRVTKAIEHFKPAVVLAVGVGFGLKGNQSLGDVLISNQVTTYESARLNGDGSTSRRAEILAATPAWLERAKYFELDGIKRRVGLVLCGEKLVDNANFRESLRKDYPLAIGGDMESFGVATACNGHDRFRIGWLVIKGISDLGDGAKNAGGELQADLDQYLAAYRAAMVAFSTVYLRRPDVPTPDEAAKAWLLRQAGPAVGGGAGNGMSRGGSGNDAHARREKITPLDREMLMHQASHAIECLQCASAYWAALQASTNLQNWLTAQGLISPSVFVETLHQVPPGELPRVMRELRNVFKEQKNRPTENELLIAKEAEVAAAATVACFLFCTCLLIEAEAGDGVVGLPSVGDRDASHLLASLIALVMAGGRLELRPSAGALPTGSETHRVQRTGLNPQFDFERQLYANLVKRPWSISAGQKTGELSGYERNELLEELRDRRGDGVRTKAMCFIVDDDEPSVSGVDVAREIGVPIFHASAEVSRVLFGLDAATLVTMLRHLWADVCAYHSADAADSAPP